MLHKNYIYQIIFKKLYYIKYYYQQTDALHIIIYKAFMMYNIILINILLFAYDFYFYA